MMDRLHVATITSSKMEQNNGDDDLNNRTKHHRRPITMRTKFAGSLSLANIILIATIILYHCEIGASDEHDHLVCLLQLHYFYLISNVFFHSIPQMMKLFYG